MTNSNNSMNQGPGSTNNSKISYPKYDSLIMPFIDAIEIYTVVCTVYSVCFTIILEENVVEIDAFYLRKTKN